MGLYLSGRFLQYDFWYYPLLIFFVAISCFYDLKVQGATVAYRNSAVERYEIWSLFRTEFCVYPCPSFIDDVCYSSD